MDANAAQRRIAKWWKTEAHWYAYAGWSCNLMEQVEAPFWDMPHLLHDPGVRNYYRRLLVRHCDERDSAIAWLGEVMRGTHEDGEMDILVLTDMLARATADQLRRFIQIPDHPRQFACGRKDVGCGRGGGYRGAR
jgi:hypothetical protein